MQIAGRQTSVRLFAVVLSIAAWVFLGCGPATNAVSTPEPETPGWTSPALASADGTELSTRFWRRDRERLVIYFHEYLSDQSAWWHHVEARAEGAPSALTLDFRGHGESPGDADELQGILQDAGAALTFAREQGYREITLVGSGMGAAIAMKVAHDDPGPWVIALSAPSEFGELMPIDIAPRLRDRLALIATEGDVSAAHSLDLFVAAAALPEERWLLGSGRAHGVEMITLAEFEETREFFLAMLDASWDR